MVAAVQHVHAICDILFYVFVPVCRRIVANNIRAQLTVGAVINLRIHLWDLIVISLNDVMKETITARERHGKTSRRTQILIE